MIQSIKLKNNMDEVEIGVNVESPFHLYTLDIGEIPIELSVVKGYKQAGNTITSKAIGNREIAIKFEIITENEESLIENKRKINRIINPNSSLELWIDDYVINCTADAYPVYTRETSLTLVTAEITLICPSPYFTKETTITNLAEYKPNVEFPVNFLENNTELGIRDTDIIKNIPNDGEIETGCLFKCEFTGNFKNLIIENTSNKKIIKITQQFFAGDKVTIDTRYHSKCCIQTWNGTLDMSSNKVIILDKGSDWDFSLNAGDNLVRYDCADRKDINNINIQLQFNPQYIEVM